jgi:aryl-alcohol dehydrogenase-like predicted oxidoreductase
MRESRRKEWRSAARLIQGLDQGLKEAGLDYVDLWRITLPMDQGHHDMISLADIREVEEGAMEALLKARQQGKARFTGVSSHNRTWLKSLIEQYHEAVYVVLFPYTAGSKELPTDSIFRAVRKADVGVLGIKPFADNALFKGDGTINSPHAEEDSRRARLALRYILSNPAVTAPIPGLINAEQVKNAAQAVMERRKLDVNEKAELDGAAEQMWANLSPSHLWLKEWERV